MTRAVGIGVLLAGALLGAGYATWAAWRTPAVPEPPYARWRNGVIVYVRNCERPADETTLLRCAALTCAQRVTEKLTNAQQAKLALTRFERAADGRAIEVEGTLAQYLPAPTLPSGFQCTMQDHRYAEPRFAFDRRSHVPPAGQLLPAEFGP